MEKTLEQYILDIDFMTTKEFCDTYNIPHPQYTGDVKTSADQFLAIDAIKQRMFVEYAKKLRKEATNVQLLHTAPEGDSVGNPADNLPIEFIQIPGPNGSMINETNEEDFLDNQIKEALKHTVTSLTPNQKAAVIEYNFYNGRREWVPKPFDYYTTPRADLELYQILEITDTVIKTKYCTDIKSENVAEWPIAEFFTGFGINRIHVPLFILQNVK